MIENPFSFGDPIKESKHFVGRRREVAEIYTAIGQASSISIVGERRIGKSSLLLHVTDPSVTQKNGLDPAKYIFAHFSFEGYSTISPTALWRQILNSALGQVRQPALLEQVAARLAREPLSHADLDDLLGKFRETDVTFVVALDEFDTAAANPNFDKDFFGGLRTLSAKHRVSWLVASHRDMIDLRYAHSDAIGSPFFNFFRVVSLGNFTDDDVDTLLKTGLADTGIAFKVSDRAFLNRYAGHHPYFVQAAAHYLFTAYAVRYLRAGQPDEKWIVERLRDVGRQQFRYYWDGSENGEKLILATLALIEQGDVAHYKLDQSLADKSPTKEMLRRLRQRALIEDDHGSRPHVFSDLFIEWITEQVAYIASDRVSDFEKLIRAAKVEGPWDKWVDATERFRRGFAWVDTRAILKKVLVEQGPEVALGLLSQIIVKILFPGPP